MNKKIPFADAKKLVDAHDKHRRGQSNYPRPSGKDQTKWVWFNMESLQEMIDVINKEYPGYDPKKIGIKFYLGKYENVQGKPQYKDHLTLVMTPAEKVMHEGEEVIKDHGFSIAEKRMDEEKFVAIASGGVYENWGTVCPPTCADPPIGDSI
ncbi:hypothetical protein QWY31_14205 [Cytophagales bacterium LB-30]|uniref:SCP domain-containing protein n=1 Tax=Shiella aurantiaca TaxID=3058365 RepID=A0ABT8F8T3_9BACT|nr:hypothetical protein [Shiella aurantiaca]MDN4166659.1 hypothetical protein [Shiella aurantiaca]